MPIQFQIGLYGIKENMFKKLAIALAAMGLATSMPASAEARPNVSFELRIGNPQQFNRYKQYKHYPRCNRWEVAVKHPHRYNRYICVDRNDYRHYWRGDRYEPRHDRYDDRKWRR